MSERAPRAIAGTVDVVVIGAGHSGLAMSCLLGRRSIGHVVLEQGEIANSWRTQRWDSMRLLTPNWMARRIEEVDDPDRARRVPSPQLAGTPERATLDLNVLQGQGVRIVGRLVGLRGATAQFSGSLRNVCALADLKMNRLLAAIDQWAEANSPEGIGPVERFAATEIPVAPPLALRLGEDISTVLWATGFQPDFSWLDLPVFDAKGQLRHDRGVAGVPGLYVLGLPYLRRRKSSFIHGAEDDARELTAHLAAYLDSTAESAMRLRAVAR